MATPFPTPAPGDVWGQQLIDIITEHKAAAVAEAVEAGNATYAPKGAVFHHDFSDLTPGAALPALSDSGHQMRYVHGTSVNGMLIAGNGGITNGATSGGAAGYLEVELASNVKRVGMWVSYGTAIDGGSVVPLVWQQSLADRKLSDPINPAVPASPLHAPVGRRGAAMQVWPTDGAAGAVTLATQAYPTVPDNELVYLEATIDDDTYSLLLPDGTVSTVRSPYISGNAGRFASFEIFQITAASNAPTIVKVWASDDPDASLTQNSLLALGRASSRAQRPVLAAQTNNNVTINAPGTSGSAAVEVDATVRVTAIVPASGKLLQRVTAWVNNTAGTTLFLVPTLYDYTGTGTPLRAPSLQVSTATDSRWITTEYLHSGLTPGQDVVATWRLWATTAGVASIRSDSGTGRNVTATIIPVA